MVEKAFNRNLKTLFLHFLCPFTRELLLQPAWDSLKWENPFEHISNTGFLRQENCSLVTRKKTIEKCEIQFSQSCEPDSTECQNKVFLNFFRIFLIFLLNNLKFNFFQSTEPDSTEWQNKVFLKAAGLHPSLFHRIVYYVNEPVLKLHWVHTKQVLNKNPFISLSI